MPVHTPPPPGGPKRKPWRKSALPGHHKSGHGAPKESARKKALDVVGGVLKAASEGVERPGEVLDESRKEISRIRKKHKVKILAVLGLGAALGIWKGGSAGWDAIQDHRQDTAAEEAKEEAQIAPHEHISVPLTMSVVNGQPDIKSTSGAVADDCGKSHDMTVGTPDQKTIESLRKGRMRLPKGSVEITVVAHGQKLTYEPDADIVIDGEARDYAIDATLTKAEPAP